MCSFMKEKSHLELIRVTVRNIYNTYQPQGAYHGGAQNSFYHYFPVTCELSCSVTEIPNIEAVRVPQSLKPDSEKDRNRMPVTKM